MKHDFISVKEIFNKYKIINVPYYQRDYVWGQENDGRNLYKFIDDIFSQYKNNPSSDYFIGTLAFCSAKVNDVIDGQQRLTSLILILSILSQKCSDEVKDINAKLLFSDDEFVLQEEFYLTEELKYNLGLENHFNSQGYSVDISKTIDRINSQIDNAWSGYQESWYDGLYNYILNNVKLISLEYSNISESLKYFLNINSLSIQLTQADIFYSILSQSIRLAETGDNIFEIKQQIAKIANYPGLSTDLEDYKAYGEDRDKHGINNVIYIFLNAYYKNDNNILTLPETGVGKWMSFYKNEVFNDAIKAKEFTEKFVQYLSDFETIYKYFANMDIGLDPSSSLYLSWVLLQYEKYSDILKILTELFKTRHDYSGNNDIYNPGTNAISLDELNTISKRINLTLIWNYIRSSTKRTIGLIDNISVNEKGEYNNSILDILTNIAIEDIFNLNYNDHKNVSNINIKDYSRLIKVVMGCQESFLDKTADNSHDFSEYLQYILAGENFSIEHLYSVLEYENSDRLSNWQSKKNKFFRPEDFDTERFRFENLSLLDKQMNSSANSDEIKDKLEKYKNARKVLGSNWEYLIQSLADGSEYYKNEKIQTLNLPERKLADVNQNTWELSSNNREFNIKLLNLALQEIANK